MQGKEKEEWFNLEEGELANLEDKKADEKTVKLEEIKRLKDH